MSKSSHRLKLVFFLGASAFTLLSCEPASEPTTPVFNPQLSLEGCWPIGGDCEHRVLTTTEANRITTLTQNLNTQADSRCATIQNLLMADMGAEPKQILVWTNGPSTYHPDNYYGDRHNAPGITHITPLGLSTNENLMRTIIHEAAHGVGATTDTEAEELEDLCLGVFDI